MTSEVMEALTPGMYDYGMPVDVRAGTLLREWRETRRLSQLDLSLEAEISPRHLSCLETGKAQPSRDMIARLSMALRIPLRERNMLLIAAGYAPEYPETELNSPELEQVHRAIDFILKHQEPYPAFVLNRYWDILFANEAAVRMAQFLCGGSKHMNMMRQLFDPHDLRAAVANWEEIAGDVIRHLHEEVVASPSDARARSLLEEALSYPGVPAGWRRRQPGTTAPPVLTVEFQKGSQTLRFFSTFTTFGTSRYVTVDELHIECTFPADETTAEFCRMLAR